MKSLTLALLMFCYLAVPTWAADNEPTVVSDTADALTLKIPADAVFPQDQTQLQWITVKGKPTYAVAASPPDEESRAVFEALTVPQRQAFLQRRSLILNIFAQGAHRVGFIPVAMEFGKDKFGDIIAKIIKPKPDPERDKLRALDYEERGRRKIQGVLNKVNKILWAKPTAIAAADEFGLQLGPVGPAIIIGGGTSVGDKVESTGPAKKPWGFSVGVGLGVNLGVNLSKRYARFSLFATGELLSKLMGGMLMGQIRAPLGLYGRASDAADQSPFSKGDGYYSSAPGAAILTDKELSLLATPEMFLGTGAGVWETKYGKVDVVGFRVGLGAFGTKWIPWVQPEGALWRVVSGPIAAIGKGAASLVQRAFGRGGCRKAASDIAPLPPEAPKT